MPRPLPDPASLLPSVRDGPVAGQPISVRGGAGGIEAYADELTAVAQRLGGCGLDLGGAAASLHLVALDLGELESTLFDPVGFARAEAAVLAALDGPRGLLALAAGCGVLDAALRAAAVSYVAADRLSGEVAPLLQALTRVPEAAAALLPVLRDLNAHQYGRALSDLQGIVTADPAVVAVLLGPLEPLLRALAAACPVPAASLQAEGDDPSPTAACPPRGVSDLISGLAHRDTGTGSIDVRLLTYTDGTRRAIVDITGMRTVNPLATGDVTSPLYADQAMHGQDTAYENGVLNALQAAGVRPTDDVMLVGHSEGGLVAVNTARDAVTSGRYNVTHVITAGSPVGLTAGSVPRSVQVLSLENTGDPVPELDGRPNPDRPNVTTVTVNHDDGRVLDDHGLDTAYLPGAEDVDTSANASVLSYLTSASGYLDATSVVTKAYQVGVG